MSDDDFTQMIELLDQNEKNEWSRGYEAGRKSTDNDISLLKEELKLKELSDKLAN